MKKQSRFICPGTLSTNQLLTKISENYAVIKTKPVTSELFFHDTFDWRLFNKGYILYRQATEYHLYHIGKKRDIETTKWRRKTPAKFWYDFPNGKIRLIMRSLLGVRALRELTSCRMRSQELAIPDSEGADALLISIVSSNLPNVSRRKNVNTLTVDAVKGDKDLFKQFIQFVTEIGLEREIAAPFVRILQASGKEPGSYAVKKELLLKPSLPSRQAMKLILTHMVEVMQQNEEGIKSDIDTEFLHDFRISVRRTRSALGQIKKVLPQEVTDRFRKDFALIGQSTNHLRDLDVYLLRKGQYHDLLPKDLRKGINPFFQHIASERTKERTRVIRFLNGTRYAEIMRDWKQYLGNQEEEPESQNASKPIINLARKVIRKKYDLALRQGKAIKASSPDEALHELRLTCKKLRYLLEIFSSLFPRKKINRLISQLKKLQDNLGRYNDLIIQQDRLKEYLDQVDPQSARALDIAAAIGGLVAHLHLEQIKVRSEFRATFVNFSRIGNVKLCRELFQ